MTVPVVEFEIVTLFPELFDSFLAASLLGKAIESGLVAVHRTNPRDFAAGKHRSVDDAPYGGGPGMILRVEPVVAAIEHVITARGPARRILLSPQGRLFDQRATLRLLGPAREATAVSPRRMLFICGRYEGVDERIADLACDEVLSIGDYVLAGGEIAAAVIIEAVARLVPGVVGCSASVVDESHAHGRLEYPQWTRPERFRDRGVPAVLMSGDHAAIARWRQRESLLRTRDRRPDLLREHPVTESERPWLDEDETKR